MRQQRPQDRPPWVYGHVNQSTNSLWEAVRRVTILGPTELQTLAHADRTLVNEVARWRLYDSPRWLALRAAMGPYDRLRPIVRLHLPQAKPVIPITIPPEGTTLKEIERGALIEALHITNGVQVEAAKLLGITPRVISRKIKVQKITWRPIVEVAS